MTEEMFIAWARTLDARKLMRDESFQSQAHREMLAEHTVRRLEFELLAHRDDPLTKRVKRQFVFTDRQLEIAMRYADV